jgi:hypothetical protein
MESILSIDLKNNESLLSDFEGMEPGDTIKIVGEFTISELSANRLSAPLSSVSSVTLVEGEEDDEDDKDKKPEGEEEPEE